MKRRHRLWYTQRATAGITSTVNLTRLRGSVIRIIHRTISNNGSLMQHGSVPTTTVNTNPGEDYSYMLTYLLT